VKRIVTFAKARPAPQAGQLVLERASIRSIADFVDIEAMIKEGVVTSVVVLNGDNDISLHAWADVVQREAERK